MKGGLHYQTAEWTTLMTVTLSLLLYKGQDDRLTLKILFITLLPNNTPPTDS